MIRFESEKFLKLMERVNVLKGVLMPGVGDFSLAIDDETRRDAAAIEEMLKELSLPMSCKVAQRLIHSLEVSSVERQTGYEKFQNLTNSIHDELEDRVFLLLTKEEAASYIAVQPFGKKFAESFPLATYELDEAEKCMALGRHTAAVFHWMRVVEIGLRAVSSCLGSPTIIPGQGRSWGAIIRDLRNLRTGSPPKWPENAYFSSVVGLLEAVKHAWRDDTMHVENKYNQSEAEAIRVAVSALMQNIASRMNQRGTPKAKMSPS